MKGFRSVLKALGSSKSSGTILRAPPQDGSGSNERRFQKRVFLHIGAHKTATTTIQRNIKKNRDVLALKYDIYVFDDGEIYNSDLGAHFKKISQGKLSDDKFDASIVKARCYLESRLDEINNDKILISWEGFLGHSSLDHYEGIYTHIDSVTESIRRIFGNHTLRILTVIRRQDDFIESCYLQQIKEGRSLSFSEFFEKIDISKLSWLELMDSLNKVFPNRLAVCTFERIKTDGTEVFLEYCLSKLFEFEIDAVDFAIVNRANASLSEKGVDISRELLPQVIANDRPELNRIIFRNFSNSKYGKAKYFDEFTRRFLIDKYRQDNKALFDKYVLNHESNLPSDPVDLQCWQYY